MDKRVFSKTDGAPGPAWRAQLVARVESARLHEVICVESDTMTPAWDDTCVDDTCVESDRMAPGHRHINNT
jgi:hypothetical protein